jgi:hypothetical protein
MAKTHLAETNFGENNPAGFGGEGSRAFLGRTGYSGQSLTAEPFPNSASVALSGSERRKLPGNGDRRIRFSGGQVPVL